LGLHFLKKYAPEKAQTKPSSRSKNGQVQICDFFHKLGFRGIYCHAGGKISLPANVTELSRTEAGGFDNFLDLSRGIIPLD
jgi:hypothetical protein